MNDEIIQAGSMLLELLRTPPQEPPVWPLSDDIYQLIGSVIVHWNRVEFELDAIVAVLLMPQSVSVTSKLMHGHSVAGKADAFRAMVFDQPELVDVRDDAEKLWKMAKGLSGDRNRVAHGRWQYLDEGPPSSTANLHDAENRLTIDETRKIEFKVRSLHERLGRLRAYINFTKSMSRLPMWARARGG